MRSVKNLKTTANMNKKGSSLNWLGGVRVDLDAVLKIDHRCVPGQCGLSGSCCARYEVCVERTELSRVVGLMPRAARYSPDLVSDGELSNVFEETEDGLICLDRDEDGMCVFAYRSGKNMILCSLHSAALDSGIPPHEAKPGSCSLWPLALSDGPEPVLSVDEDAFMFPCNTLRQAPGPEPAPGIASILESLFGTAGFFQPSARGAGAGSERPSTSRSSSHPEIRGTR